MGKDHGRYQLVFEMPALHATIETVGQATPRRDRDRRQLRAARHIAKRKDVLHASLLKLVGRDKTPWIELDAGFIRIQARRIRRSADRPREAVDGTECPPVFGVQHDTIVGSLDRLRDDPGDDINAVPIHRLHEFGAERGIELPQDTVLAHHQLHVRVKRAENAGELDRDVPAARDQHPLRPLLQLEKTIRRNPEFRAGDRGNRGVPSRGNDDALRLDATPVDIDRVRIDKAGPAFEVRDTAPVEVVRVDAVEAFDVRVASRLEAGPVVAPHLHIKSVVCDVMKLVRLVCRIPHHFFRHTANVDAGAAERPLFHDCGFRPVFRCALRVGQPTAASADHEHVISFRHCFLAPLRLFILRVLPGACDNMRRLERISVRQ